MSSSSPSRKMPVGQWKPGDSEPSPIHLTPKEVNEMAAVLDYDAAFGRSRKGLGDRLRSVFANRQRLVKETAPKEGLRASIEMLMQYWEQQDAVPMKEIQRLLDRVDAPAMIDEEAER